MSVSKLSCAKYLFPVRDYGLGGLLCRFKKDQDVVHLVIYTMKEKKKKKQGTSKVARNGKPAECKWFKTQSFSLENISSQSCVI